MQSGEVLVHCFFTTVAWVMYTLLS